MLAVTKHPDSLRNAIDAISGVLVDTTLRISPAGFDIRQLNSAGDTFVALSLPSYKWDEWECVNHGHYGVNIPSLAKVLKTAKDAKEIRLVIEDSTKMRVVATGGGIQTHHTINLLQFALADVKPPDLDYPLEIDLSSKTFKRLMRDLGSLADQVTIHQVEGGIQFVASGPFTEQKVMLPEGDYLAFINDHLDQAAGPYSLRILSMFARANDNDLMRLKAKPGLPLVLEYSTALGAVLFATSPL
ncbi:MAG: hypothetical protein GY872_16605 [Roseibacillus sp.]|nr:hypothetical protein [Roseibacillus sp.]